MPRFSINTTRRSFLVGTAAGAALGVLAFQARAQAAKEVPLAEYQPEYLSAAEYAFVMAATARLIPSEGDGPGAIEARVPVFIDRQLAGDFGAAADLYMEGPFNPGAGLKKRGRIVESVTLSWLKKSPEARTAAARERERSRIGRIARRKATVEIIV